MQEKHTSAGLSHSSPLVFEAPSHQLFLGTAVGQAAVKASRAGFVSPSSLLPCELAGIAHILPSLQMRKLRPGVNTPRSTQLTKAGLCVPPFAPPSSHSLPLVDTAQGLPSSPLPRGRGSCPGAPTEPPVSRATPRPPPTSSCAPRDQKRRTTDLDDFEFVLWAGPVEDGHLEPEPERTEHQC